MQSSSIRVGFAAAGRGWPFLAASEVAIEVVELPPEGRPGTNVLPAVDAVVVWAPSAGGPDLPTLRRAHGLDVPCIALVDGDGVPTAGVDGADATCDPAGGPLALLAAIVRARRRPSTDRVAPPLTTELIAGVPGIVWEACPDTLRFTFVSEHAERLFGYPAARWIEDPDFWVQHLHPDDRARVVEQCRRETAQGRDHEMDYRMLAADGREVWLRDVVRLVVTAAGERRLRGLMVEAGQRIAAEQALRTAQRRLEDVLQIGGIGTFAIDLVHDTKTWDAALQRLYGRDWDPAHGAALEPFLEHVHPDDRQRVRQQVADVRSGQAMAESEFRYQRGDGRTIWVASTLVSERDDGGRLVALTGAVVEITRLKLNETLRTEQAAVLGMIAGGAALELTLGRLLQAVESQDPTMLASIMLVSDDGRFLESAARSRLPQSFVDRVGRLPVAPEIGSCGRAAAIGEPVYVRDAFEDPQFDCARGVVRDFEVRSSWSQPIFDSQKRLLGTLAIYGRQPGLPGPEQVQLMEVATHTAAICVERHRSELAMQKTLTRLDLALRATGLGVWERDLRTDQVWWSPQCLRILGVDEPPDLKGWRALVHPEDLPGLMAVARDGMQHREELRAEFRVVLAGGRVRWLENVGRVEFDEHGRPRRMSGTMQDITERRAAAEALRASEERFQLAMRGANDGLWDWDLLTRDLYLSPRWKSMLGYADHEMPSDYATWEQLTHPDDIPPTIERVEDAIEGRTEQFEAEFRMRHRDGEWLDILSRGFVVRAADGAPVRMVGTHVDITARKRAEQALRESEERARLMIEAAIDAVVTIDEAGRVVQWNREAEHMFGRSREAAIGRHVADLVMSPAERTAFRRALVAPGTAGGAVLGQRTQRIAARADGSEFPVDLAVVALQHDGRTLFHAFVRDITEQQRAERVRVELESQLREAQKMEAIGTLAGGIAHDFNNILAVILGTVETLMQEGGRDDEERAGLGTVRQAATRGSMLVRQILTFSRSQRPDLRPVLLDAIVVEVCELQRGSMPAGVELRAGPVAGEPSTILGDATQLHQCLVNLCANAAHASAAAGGHRLVELRIGREHVDRPTPVGSATIPPGRYVTLAVVDRGVGMTAQVVERMFEPFFSTRPPDQGTGLGLAVVHGVVTGHRGAIAVDSEPGRGTTVTVWFPMHHGEPDVPLPRLASAPRGQGQRVLFVDDEPALAELGRRALERLGYHPEVFTDPRMALAAFERDPAAFQLVVTDQIMPELSGLDLAAAIRQRRRDLPIVLSSGYVPPEVQTAAAALGIERFVGKPCSSAELARILQGTLERKQ